MDRRRDASVPETTAARPARLGYSLVTGDRRRDASGPAGETPALRKATTYRPGETPALRKATTYRPGETPALRSTPML